MKFLHGLLAAGLSMTFGMAQAQSESVAGVERVPAAAQENSSLSWSPRASVRTDVWSSSRSLDDQHDFFAAALWADGKVRSDWGTWVWNGWVRAQSPGLNSQRERVRELYWRQAFGPVDVRAGRLMPAWGRADGLNPTDNVSARDYTLLAPEDADLRAGRNGAQIDFALPHAAGQSSALSVYWLAQGDSHRIPLTRIEGVTYRIQAPPTRDSWALKWDYSREGMDGSLSYYDGTDLMPDLSLAALSFSGIDIALRNARVTVWGADLSVQRGAIVWRAEAAHARPRVEEGVGEFAHKRPAFTVVGGPEWSGGGWTVGTQAVWQWVRGFRSPNGIVNPIARDVAWRQAATANQVAAQQGGVTVRLARRALNDNLLLETTLFALWPVQEANSHSSSGVWRSKMDYALDDHWNLQFGHERLFGPPYSQTGQLIKNRLAYVQLRRSF